MARWELHEQLGQGGYGAVYRARLDDGQIVAIKRLASHRATSHLTSLRLEADLSAQLAHPNIVAIYDAQPDDEGHICLIMEYVSGIDLARLLRMGRVLMPAAVHVARSMLTALAHAQEIARIAHRDVSPDNVMISWDGEVKLSDFGLAKIIGGGDHQSGRVRGKLHYMSPEQYAGRRVDERSDLFSVGLILYQLLAGVSPYGNSDHAVFSYMAKQTELPPLAEGRPWLPPALCAVVTRLLERRREDRYANAHEALAALPDWPGGKEELSAVVRQLRNIGVFSTDRSESPDTESRDAPASTDAPAAPVRPEPSRHRLWYTAGAVLLLGIAGLTAAWILSIGSSSTSRAAAAPKPVVIMEPAARAAPDSALASERPDSSAVTGPSPPGRSATPEKRGRSTARAVGAAPSQERRFVRAVTWFP